MPADARLDAVARVGHRDDPLGLVQPQRLGRLTHLRPQPVEVEVGQVVALGLVRRVQQGGVDHPPLGLGATLALHRHAEGVQPQVGHRVLLLGHGAVLGLPRGRRGNVPPVLLLGQALAGGPGGPPRRGGRQVDAAEAPQDVVGADAVRLEDASQADQGAQGGAQVVVAQAVGLIEGKMAAMATRTKVVSAGGGDVAVGGEEILGAVALEAGVRLAVGTDDAGAYVALFFAVSSPAWWASAATWRARSPRSCSICPKALSGGRSTRRSAICRSLGSACSRKASRRAWIRVSRSSAGCKGEEAGVLNIGTFLVLRPGVKSGFSSRTHLTRPPRILHPLS